MKNPISRSSLVALIFLTNISHADQQIQDDLIVTGSICAGFDCANNESFGFDTLRLKENNLRIRFIDSSSSSSFPNRDWQITVNDSINGGSNYFAIEDLDAGTVPFYIGESAATNSLYVNSSGNVGFGTSTPSTKLHTKYGNTPTLRLEQDSTSGWSAQTWDIGGNEANFFVRDVTNGGVLPFRIVPNAPNSSLYIAADGDVGFETSTPDGLLDVAHSSDANNHAFLISPTSNVGVNIDNGFTPNGLFDIQTTGGLSRFTVHSDGDIGINITDGSAPAGLFEARTTGGDAAFNILSDGDVGIGTSSFVGRFEIQDRGLSNTLLRLYNNGTLRLGTDWQIKSVTGGSFIIEKVSDTSIAINIATDGTITIGSGITVAPSGDVTVTNLTITGTCTGC